MGRSEHTFGENDLWCTPEDVFGPILDALKLDSFGLDPFGNPLGVVPAKEIVLLPTYVSPILEIVTNTFIANGWSPTPESRVELEESVRERYVEFLAMTKRIDSRIYYADAYVPSIEPHSRREWTADWSGRGTVFCNGPTSECDLWAEKMASATGGDENVSLWPARTGARYFRRYIVPCNVVLFWEGRIKFRGAKHHAPWHNCISFRTSDPSRAEMFWRGMRKYGWQMINRRS